MSEVLKFYSRGAGCVYIPGVQRVAGAPPPYVNRDFIPGRAQKGKDPGKPAMHPANAKPVVIDLSTHEGHRHANALVRHMRRGDLFGDEAACRFAGLRYEEFELVGGVNVPARPRQEHKSQITASGKMAAAKE